MQRIQYRLQKDKDINILIKLKRRIEFVNLYDVVNEDDTNVTNERITITGQTKSRLNEVRSYDPNRPFIVGLNGVSLVDGDIVEYVLDGITYRTRISDGNTTYAYQTTKSENIKSNIIPSMFSDLVEAPRQTNIININRNEQSVLDIHNRINRIKSFSELKSYGNRFFNAG